MWIESINFPKIKNATILEHCNDKRKGKSNKFIMNAAKLAALLPSGLCGQGLKSINTWDI